MEFLKKLAYVLLVLVLMIFSAGVAAFGAYYWGKDRASEELKTELDEEHQAEIDELEEEFEEEKSELRRDYEEQIMELENEVEDLEKRLNSNTFKNSEEN